MQDSVQTVLGSCLVCKSHTSPNPWFCHTFLAPDSPFMRSAMTKLAFYLLPLVEISTSWLQYTTWLSGLKLLCCPAPPAKPLCLSYLGTFSRNIGVYMSCYPITATSLTLSIITELSNISRTLSLLAGPYRLAKKGAFKRANRTLVSILWKMLPMIHSIGFLI